MAKKYQHWEIVFRTIEKDEWTWRNLPFHLKFEDKESAEKKYKEIVEDVVETGHVSMPGRLSDYYDNKIIEEKEYDKRDDLSCIKSTEFEISRYTDKPYNLSVELCEYDFSINYEF